MGGDSDPSAGGSIIGPGLVPAQHTTAAEDTLICSMHVRSIKH